MHSPVTVKSSLERRNGSLEPSPPKEERGAQVREGGTPGFRAWVSCLLQTPLHPPWSQPPFLGNPTRQSSSNKGVVLRDRHTEVTHWRASRVSGGTSHTPGQGSPHGAGWACWPVYGGPKRESSSNRGGGSGKPSHGMDAGVSQG